MWKKTYPYLNDEDFLKLVDNQHLQSQYVKLTLLNWNEDPIDEIQGLASGGSISLNGNSSVRRTCSLTMTVQDIKDAAVTNVNNLISIGKKVYIEIGIKNNTNKYKKEYPIIWFPQGLFVFTQAAVSTSVGQGITISAQLKDKMCLLNGECGGIFTSSVQFDTWETIDTNGNWIIQKPTIATIIREAVNHFGKEDLGRILIADIDEKIKMVERWTGSNPVYLINDSGSYYLTVNRTEGEEVGVQTYEYGDDIGFTYTDFTYPSELIAKPGDNICTAVLDKIKNTLGNYEYYYDVFGNFIFQEIKNYLNTTQATIEINNLTKDDYIVDMTKGKSVYDFSDSQLALSFSNNPQYNRIKNDFVIWGTRTDSANIKHDIRYHLAIDTKPKIGNIYQILFYTDPDDGLKKAIIPLKYDNKNSFPTIGVINYFYLDKSTNKIYIWNSSTLQYEEYTDQNLINVKTTDWRTELYLQGVSAEVLGLDSNYYYPELAAEWPKLYNIAATYHSSGNYYTGAFYDNILEYPWDVDYWLDFIDSQNEIGALSVNMIGRRSLSENKGEYNCVFEPEVHDFVLIETGQSDTQQKREECIARNQAYIQIDPNIFNKLATGGLRNSCFERIKTELYNCTSYNNSISISCIPIYHLEPNTRITVNSVSSDIYGDYMINSISIPLTINGTMSISAVKCAEKI